MDKLYGLIQDINPKEICNHIENGNLAEWCNAWRIAAKEALQPKTNADRIRAMSDDELCSVVRLAAYADVCYMSCECHECVFHGLCKEDEEEMFSDEQEEITTVMKWLKQPAEE